MTQTQATQLNADDDGECGASVDDDQQSACLCFSSQQRFDLHGCCVCAVCVCCRLERVALDGERATFSCSLGAHTEREKRERHKECVLNESEK